jgi:ABC-type transporter Mla subunit MlaD
VQKFAKQISADKSSTALADALNLTTNISRASADLDSTLSAASEAHNAVQEALDRAQAGATMTAEPVDPLAEARKKAERDATLAELNGTGAAAPATPPATGETK